MGRLTPSEREALLRAAAGGDHAASDRLAIERFLERHSLPPREAVLADAAPYVGMSTEERWRHFQAACRTVAAIVSGMNPEDRARTLERRHPPHPTLRGILTRLAAERRARGARKET